MSLVSLLVHKSSLCVVAILPVSSESENGIVNKNTHPQSDFNGDDVTCGNAAETLSNATVVYVRHKKN